MLWTMDILVKSDELDWNVDLEVQLFYAMRGHKPVGVNRHFQMACIHEKFRNSTQKDVTSQHIWDHLDSMYDMAALHESEIIPFPNDEMDFSLPDSDYIKFIKKEEIVKEEKARTKDSSAEEDGESLASLAKSVAKDRTKEPKEADGTEPTSKRKRGPRHAQQDPMYKPGSPATTTPLVKRRRANI